MEHGWRYDEAGLRAGGRWGWGYDCTGTNVGTSELRDVGGVGDLEAVSSWWWGDFYQTRVQIRPGSDLCPVTRPRLHLSLIAFQGSHPKFYDPLGRPNPSYLITLATTHPPPSTCLPLPPHPGIVMN
eukprot:756001-Hanusia_phi.AAC.1